jgi:hypothetical protein
MDLRWPVPPSRPVRIGGVTVTYTQAQQAGTVLTASRTSAIAPVLRAAGNPLAACDYFAAAAPYLEEARQAPKTGRAGAAGRHVTKAAFLAALTAAMRQAQDAELSRALSAFGCDERYAAAMAREAVTLRSRAHASSVRSQVRRAVQAALAACHAQAGQFSCAVAAACGTGACRFAAPALREVTAVAAPGKLERPGNHAEAGQGFSDVAVVAAVLDARPYRVSVPVRDEDAGYGADAVHAA